MSRKRTGLRNRFRNGGAGNYRQRRREHGADRYGEFLNGKCIKEDIIAGHLINPIDQRTIDPNKQHIQALKDAVR